VRPEPVTQLLQVFPDFKMIVDFAVEGDGGITVVAEDGSPPPRSMIFSRTAQRVDALPS
jgi:hypothetical protein